MNATGDFADAAARRSIREELSATLFVEAGAGTGKTAALVGRILETVRSGRCSLGEIAAITFTEAAAAELRERIRTAVTTAAAEAPADLRLRAAAAEVGEAVITTIHGFCKRLLGDFPLEAGLPLRFEVLDDVAATVAFEQRFLAFLDSLYDEPGARALLAAASCLQITPPQLRLLARQLDERWHEAPSGALPGGLEAEIERRVTDAVGRVVDGCDVLAGLAAQCRDGEDALARRIAGLAAERRRAEEGADWMDALRWLVEVQIRRAGNLGRRESWAPVEVQEVRDALAGVEAARAEALAGIADLVVSSLVTRLGAEAHRAAAARRSAGTLYFHDLLVLADELLRRSPRARAAARGRFRRLYVDEFQDTDPLQLEIVLQLGTAEGATAPEAGRLFFVGDPQQSIYRFRGADATAYLRARAALGVGEPTRLFTNFRSVPAVLEWVNAVFARLLAGGAGYTPLVPVRTPFAGRPSVTVLGGPLDEQLTQAERREVESAEVAATIAAAVDEGWPVREEERARPACYGDIAVLVPRRTGLFTLESALQSLDIPYVVSSSTLVYNSAEVQALRAALGALAPGADERAVFAALRTPLFGCDDGELVAHRQAGGSFSLAAGPGQPAGPVTEGIAVLTRLHDDAYRLGVVGLLGELLRERRVLALHAGSARPSEALRRVEFLVDRAGAFEAAGGATLAEFLAFLDLEGQSGVRNVELPTADAAEDAVRILTVHGAKGLEFPIVVLAELGGAPSGAAWGPRLLAGEGRLEARLRGGVETAGFAALAERADGEELAERLRVAYVAATRARDHLVVALHHRPAKSEAARSLAERIADLDALPPVARRAPAPGARRAGAPPAPALPPAPLGAAELDRWRQQRADLARRLSLAPGVSATGLAPPLVHRHGAATQMDPEAGDWRRPRAGTAVGRAVHRLLQESGPSPGFPLTPLADALSLEEGCPAEATTVERLARAALASPVVRRAAASARHWRELPLTMRVAGGTLEAVVDLCFEGPEGLVIVDYKTDSLSSLTELSELAEHYRPQVGGYALALEALGAGPVSEAVLLFLSVAGGVVEHRVPDLGAAAAGARKRAELLLSGAGR